MRRIENVTSYEALQYLKRVRAGREPVRRDGTVVVPVRCGECEIWFGRKHARLKWLDLDKLVLHKFSGNICQAAARLAELEPELPQPPVAAAPSGREPS